MTLSAIRRTNEGSAAFGTDYLRIQNLGYRQLDRAFTVEGWMLWSNQTANAVQTIAGTRFDNDYGWRLELRKDGAAAAFGIYCQAPNRTPAVNAEFAYDASGLAGGWHHLALSFTPRRNDTGTWELFVDGTSAGAVTNRYIGIGRKALVRARRTGVRSGARSTDCSTAGAPKAR